MANQSLLNVNKLNVKFNTSGTIVHAVNNVSFQISHGETVALVGESGSGKSVTALSILQLLPYPIATHPSGSIIFEGQEIIGASDRRLRQLRGNRISMIFQEPMTSLNPLHSVGRQVAEVIMLHRSVSKTEAWLKASELLELVALGEIRKRLSAYPHELSGGQRQRVMIAMALACKPILLIADEPTTALDVTVQAEILDLLNNLKNRFNMAVLLITHDLTLVRRMADTVCVMNEGQIVERGTVQHIFCSPINGYTKSLLRAELKGKPLSPSNLGKEIISCTDLKVHFPIKAGILRRASAQVKAVDGVSIVVREGQTVGVVGESGSGKTTLALALIRLETSKGSISFQGNNIQGYNSRKMRPFRKEMQIVFQDPFGSLSPRLSVGQIIGEGLKIHSIGSNDKERRALISEVLIEVGLDPMSQDRYPHEFSGGQRQRISIARALILKPKFMILDEPTSALDVSVQAQVIELLKTLQKRHGLAYLFISHDLKVIRAISHEVIILRHGKILEHGSSEQIFNSPIHNYTKTLMNSAFSFQG